jgi:hypothetical protein
MKHNSIAPLRSIPPIRRTFSAISIALSLVFVLAAFGANQGTSFTYQGQLRRSGAAYNGLCNFQFSLWSAVSAGTQVGSTLSMNGLNVVNGLFTATLDFGDVFDGFPIWLGTSVQCSGDGGFTPLDPRQPIAATPYALSLRAGGSMYDYDTTANRTAWYVRSFSTNGTALAGQGFHGISGTSTDDLGTGVNGFATGFASSGVSGYSGGTDASSGVNGQGGPSARAGVSGGTQNSSGSGVYGTASGANAAGVFGTNSAGAGVWGKSTGAGSAVYGQATSTGLAGRFTGSVVVEGNLIVQGSLFKSAGTFRIDHPLDPANKFLSHSFVESPDMKNMYDGNVTTDATGSATVTLPDYFDALNRDYRYQLTVLDQFAQAIVSRKIAGNTFEIRTDKPGVEVSWQVTGIRQDAYAKAHPIVIEEFKPAEQKGLYLYPAGFGAGEEKRIGHLKGPATAPGEREAPTAGSADQARSK